MTDLYERIAELKKEGLDMVLVTAIEKQGEGPVEVGKKMLVTQSGEMFGTVGGGPLEHYAANKAGDLLKTRQHLKEQYLLEEDRIIPNAKTLPAVCGGVVTFFYEFIGAKNRVVIFGAGHVAKALAYILDTLRFHVTVIDNRKATLKTFQHAHRVIERSFEEYIAEEGIPDNSMVVVCTPSHKNDYDVIHAILEKKLKPSYIGMLCSKKKLKHFLSRTYESCGKDVDLRRFYAPIGLDIGGGSPEEIAVAIAAEMLAVDHGKTGHKHMRETIDAHYRYW